MAKAPVPTTHYVLALVPRAEGSIRATIVAALIAVRQARGRAFDPAAKPSDDLGKADWAADVQDIAAEIGATYPALKLTSKDAKDSYDKPYADFLDTIFDRITKG